ncbi:hypothetical protein [Cyclobacterium xiamenense]|uniref:hypothetical protein n=1 Tax=Cyclobacterium xiamenense TaxID=1297121 RepID=UPI0012B95385|nr:hypothetical protein [Cyclobacterium xiamenense]
MMAKIELWLNIVHYCIYKMDYKIHLLSNKINPFLLIGKIPSVERNFREQGTSLKEFGNKFWTDRRYGFGIMISGAALTVFLFFVIWASFLFVNRLLGYPLNFSWHPFVFCFAWAYFISYLFVFQNEKYIKYFKKFDKRSKQEKRKYGVLSLAFVASTIALVIYSFSLLPPLP